MKKARPQKRPLKGYADGGYVPAKGEKPGKAIGAPAKPVKPPQTIKSGKLF